MPVSVVRGEGIFIQFREEVVAAWIEDHQELEESFRVAHRMWRSGRGKTDLDANFPGIRYVLLHSLSHAVMRQLALASGYSQAAIRERIYSAAPGGADAPAMAGILLMTAAPDSEGTLGGLVAQGARDAQAPPQCGRLGARDSVALTPSARSTREKTTSWASTARRVTLASSRQRHHASGETVTSTAGCSRNL